MRRSSLILIFVALAAIAVRLILIEQPFIDNWSWRQSDVAAIARNFYDHGFHFAHPQIDWAGDAEGFVGTEFPILPFTAALCYRATGIAEWVGRIQAVVFFALAIPFFYLLIRRLFGEVAALWATLFLSFAPLSIVASRAFMPDIPSLSLAVIGLYFCLEWLETEKRSSLAISAVTLSLALLIKLPTAVIGAPLAYLFWRRFGWAFLRARAIWVFAFVTLVPSLLWYWHAQRIAQTFYPYHFFGGGGFAIKGVEWYWKIARQTVLSTLNPILFLLALAGSFFRRQGKYSRAFHWWFAAMVVFIFVVGWGNRHQWYQLPLVPIAAVFAGCACQQVGVKLSDHRNLRVGLSIALVGAFGAWSFIASRPFYAPDAADLRDLGLRLKELTAPGALIVAADNGDPTVFYYAERKGWHFTEDGGIYYGEPLDSTQAIADLANLREHGAEYMVFFSSTRWWLSYYKDFAQYLAENGALLQSNADFTIYRLNPIAPKVPK